LASLKKKNSLSQTEQDTQQSIKRLTKNEANQLELMMACFTRINISDEWQKLENLIHKNSRRETWTKKEVSSIER